MFAVNKHTHRKIYLSITYIIQINFDVIFSKVKTNDSERIAFENNLTGNILQTLRIIVSVFLRILITQKVIM